MRVPLLILFSKTNRAIKEEAMKKKKNNKRSCFGGEKQRELVNRNTVGTGQKTLAN